MPKRIIDEKTRTLGSGKEKTARTRNVEEVSQGYQDEEETKGVDEDLANPELERSDDDEEDGIRPPPLDGAPSKL